MSDDAAVGAGQDARPTNPYRPAWILSKPRRTALIDLTDAKCWRGPEYGLSHWPVLLRTSDNRWFCAYRGLGGCYEVPPGCPRGVEWLELSFEQAIRWCRKEGIEAPPELMSSYESSKCHSIPSGTDAQTAAPNPSPLSRESTPEADADAWISFAKAHALTALEPYEITRACDSGKIRSQGQRKGRQVHKEDLIKYMLDRPEKAE